MKLKAFAFFLILTAFKSEEGYKIGDKISNFSLFNAVDNSKISLADYAKSKAVVLVFTSNECPYAKLYENRLILMNKEFNEKNVQFIFINPNNPVASPEDSKGAMVKKAIAKAYPFPYLIDSRQEISNLFGATKTPEVFLLKNINGNFILKYKGAIDDNPQTETDINQYYLRDALSVTVNDTPPIKIEYSRPTGCVIKK
jgi:peroxiredoxin